MVEQYYPDTERLLAQQAARRRWLTALLVVVVLVATGAMAAVAVLAPGASAAGPVVAGLLVVVCAGIPVLIWNYPRVGLYLLVVSAIACGAPQGNQTWVVPTSFIPMWWNLSIVGRTYGAGNALESVYLSPAELIWILTATVWVIRTVVSRTFEFRTGEHFWPIAGLTLAFALGAVHGWASGGDTTAMLWEVRPMFVMLAAYLLACNLVTTRAEVGRILWAIAISIAAMSVFYSGSWFQGDRTDFGIKGMDHGDSMAMCFQLFVCFVCLILAHNRRLTWLAVLSMPSVLLALLGNNRRAGIASFVIAFIPLVPLLWVVFENRRTQIARFAVFFLVFSAVYLPVAWNAKGVWAFPAQALRSNSDPSARDQASNNYRYAEDQNLKMNRDLQPWIGLGFGKEFARFIPLPYIGEEKLLRYMPHNSVLWIWMRIGNLGFMVFLMMLASVLIKGTQAIRAVRDKTLRVAGVLALMQLLMHYVYGKYDLQWASPRMMFFTGALIGILAVIRRIEQDDPPPAEPAQAA
jgi:hypothetical protein